MKPKLILSTIIAISLSGIGLIAWNFHSEVPALSTWQELKIPQGKHAARPLWWSYTKRQRLELQHVFDQSAGYVQPEPHHLDWEKLTGLSFHLFSNHKNSVMVSWRYSVDCDCIEAGIYAHIDGERVIFREPGKEAMGLPRREAEVFMRTPLDGGTLKTYINILQTDDPASGLVGVTISNGRTSEYIEIDFPIAVQNRRTRVINPYIGRGGRFARQDTYILRKLIE